MYLWVIGVSQCMTSRNCKNQNKTISQEGKEKQTLSKWLCDQNLENEFAEKTSSLKKEQGRHLQQGTKIISRLTCVFKTIFCINIIEH